MPSNHLILCRPLLLLFSIFPGIRIFSNESALCIFAFCNQNMGASLSAWDLTMNIQGWFPLGWTGLISLLSKGLSRVFSSTTVWKHQFFGAQPSLWSNSHICIWLLEKPYLWLHIPLLAKWCLCFWICCLCLPSLFFQGASLLISWSLSAVILEPRNICLSFSHFKFLVSLLHYYP